ncbi:MAG: hypothetical protein HFH86_04220 [Bacilli bacterium]|nr:hypothetical protein [Bacilli bacterium]
MKLIELKQEHDLQKLKNLKGKDYIFLKVYASFEPDFIEAIDLVNFSGTLDVSFENKDLKPCFVYMESNSSRKWIFQNINKVDIIMPPKIKTNIKYTQLETEYHVKSEKDFQNIVLCRPVSDDLVIYLEQDLVLDRISWEALAKYSGKIQIEGNRHKIYVSDENFKNILEHSSNISLQGCQVILVDQVIRVFEYQDLLVLFSLKNGRVVINIENDLSRFEMASITLNQFLGSLIILGNDHTISNCIIKSNSYNAGLISSIHPTSNLEVSHLTFQHIQISSLRSVLYSGVILGQRVVKSNSTIKQKHFMPGRISFDNCHIIGAKIPVALKKSGTFVGLGDDAIDIWNSSSKHVRTFEQKEIEDWIGQLSYRYLYPSMSELEISENTLENDAISVRKRVR